MTEGSVNVAARLREKYEREVVPNLMSRFSYKNRFQVPRIKKIVLNMGVGEAKQDTSMLEAASEQLATIAGQSPSVRRAKKSIAAFKLREGMPVGVAVTLRRERMYEMLDRLVSIAIPRFRDFRGLSPRAFDGRGNYSLGIKEQVVFPEIDYDAIDQIRGLNITITTSASSDEEAYELLSAFGMPFRGELPGMGSASEEEQAELESTEERQARAEAQKEALEELKADSGAAAGEDEAAAEGDVAGGDAPSEDGDGEEGTTIEG